MLLPPRRQPGAGAESCPKGLDRSGTPVQGLWHRPTAPTADNVHTTEVIDTLSPTHQVRTTSDTGEPRFVLVDVCKALGLSNPTVVSRRLDADALSQAEVIDSMGRKQLPPEGGARASPRRAHQR